METCDGFIELAGEASANVMDGWISVLKHRSQEIKEVENNRNVMKIPQPYLTFKNDFTITLR